MVNSKSTDKLEVLMSAFRRIDKDSLISISQHLKEVSLEWKIIDDSIFVPVVKIIFKS